MRWNEDHESPDVIDRRGESGGGGGVSSGGIFLLFTLLRSPFGWVVLLVAGVWFGLTQLGIIGTTSQRAHGGPGDAAAAGRDDKLGHFVGFVLDDAQDSWEREFAARGKSYRRAKLVLFTDSTNTACGRGRAATGPFYCPADERVYIDLGFYRALAGKLGARGQFAQAYVIAHEIGHHVQKLTGASERVHRRGDTEGADGPSVRLELQADCYAGIWAHSTGKRDLLESGDIASALRAAAAIGDDRLQRMGNGTVSPETFTHGTSAQRSRWFKRGYESGRFASCDTFSAGAL